MNEKVNKDADPRKRQIDEKKQQSDGKETVIQKRREQLKQNYIKSTKPLKKAKGGPKGHGQLVIEPVPRELMQGSVKAAYMTPARKVETEGEDQAEDPDEYQLSPYTNQGGKKGRGSYRTPQKVKSSPRAKFQSLNASMSTFQRGLGQDEGPSEYYGLQGRDNSSMTLQNDNQNDQSRLNRTQNVNKN